MNTALTIAGVIGAALWLLSVVLVVLGYRSATGGARGRLQWLAWGAVVTATIAVAAAVLSVLVDWPPVTGAGVAVGCVVLPLSVILGRSPRAAPAAERVLVGTIVVAGLVGLVGAVYVLVVIGLGRVPEGDERATLALSMAAAALACLLAFPARRRLESWANQQVFGERHSPDEAMRTFGSRMSRAVPMDELLLQLVESLKMTMQLRRRGGLDRDRRCAVASGLGTRARAGDAEPAGRGGAGRCAGARAGQRVDPGVGARPARRAVVSAIVRSVSVAHLGDPARAHRAERAADDAPFTEEEDRVSVELARQVGLALHNVRLDSALQACLDELQVRNERAAWRRGCASSPPPTSRGARSSGTSTTARNSIWLRSR